MEGRKDVWRADGGKTDGQIGGRKAGQADSRSDDDFAGKLADP